MSSSYYFKMFLLCMVFSLAGCLESSFQLSDESRLPKWFVIPEGKNAHDYTVQIDLHSTIGGGGGKTVIKLYERDKTFPVERYTITLEEQPSTLSIQLSSPPVGYPKGYPAYIVATINDVSDIIELRKMEPVFYMTDDPAIWEELGVEQKQ
jgi:hypothetical protein